MNELCVRCFLNFFELTFLVQFSKSEALLRSLKRSYIIPPSFYIVNIFFYFFFIFLNVNTYIPDRLRNMPILCLFLHFSL